MNRPTAIQFVTDYILLSYAMNLRSAELDFDMVNKYASIFLLSTWGVKIDEMSAGVSKATPLIQLVAQGDKAPVTEAVRRIIPAFKSHPDNVQRLLLQVGAFGCLDKNMSAAEQSLFTQLANALGYTQAEIDNTLSQAAGLAIWIVDHMEL